MKMLQKIKHGRILEVRNPIV